MNKIIKKHLIIIFWLLSGILYGTRVCIGLYLKNNSLVPLMIIWTLFACTIIIGIELLIKSIIFQFIGNKIYLYKIEKNIYRTLSSISIFISNFIYGALYAIPNRISVINLPFYEVVIKLFGTILCCIFGIIYLKNVTKTLHNPISREKKILGIVILFIIFYF